MKLLTILYFLICLNPLISQDSSKILVSDFPEGIYHTKQQFVKKIPLKHDSLNYKYLLSYVSVNSTGDTLYDQLWFLLRNEGNAKLMDAFAVKYRGQLYIKQEEIAYELKKEDKGQGVVDDNLFQRVKCDGKFLFLEAYFRNSIGAAIEYNRTAISSSINKQILKGLVYDPTCKCFNLFRNCNDFNEFLVEQNYTDQINCENKDFSLNKVREIIQKIIK